MRAIQLLGQLGFSMLFMGSAPFSQLLRYHTGHRSITFEQQQGQITSPEKSVHANSAILFTSYALSNEWLCLLTLACCLLVLVPRGYSTAPWNYRRILVCNVFTSLQYLQHPDEWKIVLQAVGSFTGQCSRFHFSHFNIIESKPIVLKRI